MFWLSLKLSSTDDLKINLICSHHLANLRPELSKEPYNVYGYQEVFCGKLIGSLIRCCIDIFVYIEYHVSYRQIVSMCSS